MLTKIKSDYIIISILILGFFLRVYSAYNMGWLAEDVFFIDFIDMWFKDHLFKYIFQFQHHIYPPRSPEFGTPPLAMWLQSLSIIIFTKFGFSVLFSARLITVIFSTITIFVMYKLSSEIFHDKFTGYVAAFLLATSPSIIAIDSSAHVDSILAFFLLLGVYFIIKYYLYQQTKLFYYGILALALAGLTKTYAWVIIFALGILNALILSHKNTTSILKVFFSKKYFIALIMLVFIPIIVWSGYRDIDHITRTLGVVKGVGSLSNSVGTGGIFSEYTGVEGFGDKPIYYNFLMVLGRSLPIVGFFGLIGIFSVLFNVKLRNNIKKNISLFVILILILTFFMAIHYLGGPVAVYNRVLFPSILFIIIAVQGITLIYKYLPLSNKWKTLVTMLFIGGFSFMTISTTNIHFYNAYNNFLIGGVGNGSKLYRVGHGEGLELAAQWIKTTLDKNSMLYAPRIGFMRKYLNKWNFAYAPLNENLLFAISQGADYIILHNSFFSGSLNPQIQKDLYECQPIHSISFQQYPYIRIYKINPARYFNIIQDNFFTANIRRIGAKNQNNDKIYLDVDKNNLNMKYAFAKNEYVFAIADNITIPKDIDGLYFDLLGNNNGENIYIDIGVIGKGYYRHKLRNTWNGWKRFYVPFSVMQYYGDMKIDLFDSKFVKFSLDSYKENKEGIIRIGKSGFIKKKENVTYKDVCQVN